MFSEYSRHAELCVQGWIGRYDDQPISHGEGLAIILSTAGFQGWKGSFEVEMLITFCLPVV